MSTNKLRVRSLIGEEAADWFVENREGLDAEQRREFTAWLKTSPLHVEEYLALTTLTHDLLAACEPGNETLEQLVERAQQEEDSTVHFLSARTPSVGLRTHSLRWQVLALAASVSALSIGLLTVGRFWTNPRPSIASDALVLHFKTGHGEQQTYELADHSVIHLNTDSTATVRLDTKERHVILETGEADFEVAHESGRIFRVSAGSAEVVDIGTQFDVRIGQAATLVTVAEGRVNVGVRSNTQHAAQNVELSAGQQIRVATADWPAQPVAVDAARTTAWLHRQIKFDNEPLAYVTSEFNRYAPVPFEISTPALRALRISGVFSTDDTDAFVAFLRSLSGVRVEVTATRILVSQH